MASAGQVHPSAFIVTFSAIATFHNHQLPCNYGVKKQKEGSVGRNLGLPHIVWMMDVFILIPYALSRALASTKSVWPELGKKQPTKRPPEGSATYLDQKILFCLSVAPVGSN